MESKEYKDKDIEIISINSAEETIIDNTKNFFLLIIEQDFIPKDFLFNNIDVNAVGILKELLKENKHEQYLFTPLILSIRLRKKEIFKFLLSLSEVDINKVVGGSNLAINTTIYENLFDFFELLVNHTKIDINKYSTYRGNEEDTVTPLTFALFEFKDNLNFIKLLLDHPNINVNEPKKYMKPIFYTIVINNISILTILLQNKKIDINTCIESSDAKVKFTPLILATSLDCKEDKEKLDNNYNIIKLLLSHPDIDINYIEKIYNTSALLGAVKRNKINVVKLLLDDPRIDINIKIETEPFNYPFYTACSNKNIEIVKMFLENKKFNVEPNIDREILLSINTPLYYAVLNNNIDIVKILLNDKYKRSNINFKNIKGLTPLSTSISNKNMIIFKELLKQSDINVNMPIYNGITPIMLATIENQGEMVKLLLQHPQIYVDAISHIEGSKTVLQIAVLQNNTNIVNLLLKDGRINVNYIDSIGNNSILQNAILFKKDIEIIKLLVENEKIDINYKNKSTNKTAISNAIYDVENPEIVKILLDNNNIIIDHNKLIKDPKITSEIKVIIKDDYIKKEEERKKIVNELLDLDEKTKKSKKKKKKKKTKEGEQTDKKEIDLEDEIKEIEQIEKKEIDLEDDKKESDLEDEEFERSKNLEIITIKEDKKESDLEDKNRLKTQEEEELKRQLNVKILFKKINKQYINYINILNENSVIEKNIYEEKQKFIEYKDLLLKNINESFDDIKPIINEIISTQTKNFNSCCNSINGNNTKLKENLKNKEEIYNNYGGSYIYFSKEINCEKEDNCGILQLLIDLKTENLDERFKIHGLFPDETKFSGESKKENIVMSDIKLSELKFFEKNIFDINFLSFFKSSGGISSFLDSISKHFIYSFQDLNSFIKNTIFLADAIIIQLKSIKFKTSFEDSYLPLLSKIWGYSHAYPNETKNEYKIYFNVCFSNKQRLWQFCNSDYKFERKTNIDSGFNKRKQYKKRKLNIKKRYKKRKLRI